MLLDVSTVSASHYEADLHRGVQCSSHTRLSTHLLQPKLRDPLEPKRQQCRSFTKPQTNSFWGRPFLQRLQGFKRYGILPYPGIDTCAMTQQESLIRSDTHTNLVGRIHVSATVMQAPLASFRLQCFREPAQITVSLLLADPLFSWYPDAPMSKPFGQNKISSASTTHLPCLPQGPSSLWALVQ